MPNKTRWLYAGAGTLAALLIVPAAVAGYVHHRDQQRRARLADFLHDPLAGDEGWHGQFPGEDEEDEAAGEPEHDDALKRMVMTKVKWGPQTAASTQHLARAAYSESRRWSASLSPAVAPLRSSTEGAVRPPLSPSLVNPLTGQSWVNLGPTDASFEYNGSLYSTTDSGRPNTIAVNPLDPNVVYLATSGGGVWKTYDYGSGTPTWQPITETIGNLAIGAMDLDPQNPDTLYIGLGDFIDTRGGQVLKSADGGGSWGAPIQLAGTYPAAAGGLAVSALRVRDLKVDPANSNVVLVGTDVGLFRSSDGGASFGLVDLPNSGTQRAESIWSIVYTGQVGGVSRWAVSGVYACDQGTLPPDPGYGTVAGSTTPACALGNPGDIWTSTDAGASWTSRKAAGGLPALAVGRMSLAGGSTAVPASTVVYAQLGNQDAYNGSSQVGFWRSDDAGATWTQIDGTLANGTKRVFGSQDCGDVNVGGQQAYYNQAIAVDPSNANNVVVGGMLCGLRTTNGLSASPTWENVAHWLPSGGGGNVTGGTLPYVHADWHTAKVVTTATGTIVFAGTDGGLFASTNLFTAGVTPPSVNWTHKNTGLVTHLMYSVASGDPVDGNARVTFAGLQDNGTRFRNASNSTVFDQVVGGDGIGSAAGTGVYWTTTEYHTYRCVPSGSNGQCDQGGAWSRADASPSSCSYSGYGDSIPFFVYVVNAQASATADTFLTNTDLMIYRSVGTGGWTQISPCFAGFTRGIVASPNIDGLYGAPMSGGRYYVTSGCTNSVGTCSWTMSSPVGVDLDASGTLETNERVSYTSSLSFAPSTPAGKSPGDVYLAASSAAVATDGTSLVPAAVGHLFYTADRGTTWTPLHGNGTGADLPNVGIDVVRYDPGDSSNNTIWVGTKLGIYRSIDGGQTWARYGVGLPMVDVTDLFISRNGGLVRAATYGRGLWEIYPNATEKAVNGNGDWDRNLQLDGFDLGALSSRLGTTPSTNSQPYYDWNVDLTGTVNATDSSDLSSFLTRFGDHP